MEKYEGYRFATENETGSAFTALDVIRRYKG